MFTHSLMMLDEVIHYIQYIYIGTNMLKFPAVVVYDYVMCAGRF